MSRRNNRNGRSSNNTSASVAQKPVIESAAINPTPSIGVQTDVKTHTPVATINPKRKWVDGLATWLKTTIVPIIALCVSAAAFNTSRLVRRDNLDKDARDRAATNGLNKQHIYESYLLGKQLWEIEEEYVQFQDKRNKYDLPPDVAQTLVVQQAVQTAHDLDLDVSPTIKAIYASEKLRVYGQEMKNRYTEKGVDAAADILSGRIKAKYSNEAQTAFQVGRDVGWLLFLVKAIDDHEAAFKQWIAKHPERGLNTAGVGNEMTGPMWKTVQKLNGQLKNWGSSCQFGRTEQMKFPDGHTRNITFPIIERSAEVNALVQEIEGHFQN